jgi:hypothetical protein
MKIITRADVTPVITEMVKKHPEHNTTGMMWDNDGNGSCFVGTLLDNFGVSLRADNEGHVTVQYISDENATGLVLTSAYLSNVVEGALYKYVFKVKGGESFRVDKELTESLNRSITLNDAGETWEYIARNIWGIEVQPDPLAPKEPIKPIKIVTDPPVTTKKDLLYGSYMSQINHYSKGFSFGKIGV